MQTVAGVYTEEGERCRLSSPLGTFLVESDSGKAPIMVGLAAELRQEQCSG
jgi:hypothetical protein